MSASLSVVVKAKLVNWLPWTPFCLSSGDASLIDLLLAAYDDAKHFPGDVTFQGSDCVEFGMSFGNALCYIGFGFRIGSQPADRDDMQGTVGMSVAASIEAMSDRLAGRSRDWTYAAQRGEAGFRSQPFWVVAGCKQQLCRTGMTDRVAGC